MYARPKLRFGPMAGVRRMRLTPHQGDGLDLVTVHERVEEMRKTAKD